MSKVADILSAIVFVALVAVLVKNANTATVITSLGNAFDGSLTAAEGGATTTTTTKKG
jgi:hypothetical protein